MNSISLRRVLGGALLQLMALALLASVTRADSNATVTGQVTDPSGRAVSGAKVMLTNIGTNISYQAESNEEGIYRLAGLLPGVYRANVAKEGFKNIVKGDIELHVQDEISLNFALQIGSASESVTVEGGAPLLETTNAQVSGLVSGRALTELPLNGRDLSQLIVLQVGVSPSTSAGPSPISKGSVGKVAVNGTRQTMNNSTLDGADINDPEFGLPPGGVAGVQLGVEAIQEYRVILNPYDAEYGRNAGGNVQYATKSGSNEIHGSAYEFLRNSALDARNFFDLQKIPRFNRNQFGLSLAAPLVRDKTFLFVNYEGLRDRQSITTSTVVLDDNARTGWLPSAADPTVLVNVGVNPTSAQFVNLFPHANGPDQGNGTALFQGSGMQPTREDFGVFRLDHKYSEKDQFFARALLDDGDIVQPFMSTSVPGFPGEGLIRNQYYMLNWQHLFSDKLFNEAKFDYNRTKYLADTANSYPFSISLLPNRALGLLSIAGLPTVGNNLIYPIGEVANVFEGIDNVSYLHGAHAMRFGGLFKRFQMNGPFDLFSNGGYYFVDPTVFGFPAASNNPALEYFLYGVPVAYVGTDPAASNSNRAYRQSYSAFYVQDDWRVTQRLTINLGIRWEYWSNPTDANGWLSTIRNLATDSSPTPGPMFASMPKNLWSPRLGFAWQPTAGGKTVVRGGAGILRDQIWSDMYGNSRFYTPYYHSLEVIFPTFLTPPTMGTMFSIFGIPPITVGSFGVDYYAKQPYYIEYSLNIQQQLTPTLMLQAGYTGNHGTHLARSGNANPYGSVNSNYGYLPVILTDAVSNYNSLQVSLEKRFSSGLTFQTSYTFSKSLDDESGALQFEYVSENVQSQDLYNRKGSYGRSAFDRRQIFVTNFLYDLPFGPGKRFGSGLSGAPAKLAEGWRIGGIVSLESGLPFTANLGTYNHSASALGGFWPADRPDLVSGARPCSNSGNPEQWFNPQMFSLPAYGSYGNAGRNILCGPPLKQFDMTLAKQTRLKERMGLEFRAEFFNLFNHANFDVPVNTTGPNGAGGNGDQIFVGPATRSPSAGRIFRTVTSSRQIQFGLKLTF